MAEEQTEQTERPERVFPLKSGGELIQTGEGILFSRCSPGAVPLLTEPNVEIDDVLDTLYVVQVENQRLTDALTAALKLLDSYHD